MNIYSKTNNYTVKLNRMFIQNMNFIPIFSKTIKDIGKFITASDRPN